MTKICDTCFFRSIKKRFMVLSIAQIAALTSKSYEYDCSRSFQSYRDIVVFTKYGVRNKTIDVHTGGFG